MAANTCKTRSDLPHGWIERISKTYPDQVYYFNTITGASTWVVPYKRKDVPAKFHPQGKDDGTNSTAHRVFKITRQKTSKTDFPEAGFSRVLSDNSDEYGPDSAVGSHIPQNAQTWSNSMEEYAKEGAMSFHANSLRRKNSVRKCEVSSGNLGEPSTQSNSMKRSFSDVGTPTSRVRASTPKRRVGALSARHRMGNAQRSVALVNRNLQNKTFPLSDADRVPPPHGRAATFHGRGSILTSPKSGVQLKRTERKDIIEEGTPRKRTRSVESLQEGIGAPRMSVKDRRGWRDYQQSKQAQRGKCGGKKGPHEETRTGSNLNRNNNNVKSKNGVAGKKLLTSFDDVSVNEDGSLQEPSKPVRRPVDASGTRKETRPSTSRPLTYGSEGKPTTSGTRNIEVPTRPPSPAGHKEPLTVFTAGKEVDGGRFPTSPLAGQGATKRLKIILDTNVLLAHLNFVEELRDQSIQGFGRPTLIIPWIVLQELDSLKDGKPYDLEDGRRIKYKGSLASQARTAVSFINGCLINKHPRVEGQSIQDGSKKDGGVHTRSNDDKILECCLQYKNRGEEQNTDILLLTNDMNLRNKAIVSGVHAYSKEGLMEGIAGLAKTLAKALPLSKSRKETTRDARRRSLSDKKASPKKQLLTEPKILTECAVTNLVDEMVCNLKNLLRSPLSVVLETEMKEAFDDLWLDIILHKPPWTFMDIVDCIDKHWIAVFSQFCKRSTKINFENLKVFYRDNKGLGATLRSTEELLADAAQFLSHLKSHSLYNGALDAPLAQLNRMVEQLKTVRSPSLETSQEPTKPQELATSPPAAVTRTLHKSPKPAKITPPRVTKIRPPKITSPKILPPKVTPPRTVSIPTPAKRGSLRTLKEVVREASAQALLNLVHKRRSTGGRQQQQVKAERASKKIKINMNCLKPKTSPQHETVKSSGEVIEDEDVAMDTSSEPECIPARISNSNDGVFSPSPRLGCGGDGRVPSTISIGTGPMPGVYSGDKSGDSENNNRFSLDMSSRCSSEFSPSSNSPLITGGSPSALTALTNQQPSSVVPVMADDRVQQVLERAYQEMRASCTRVEQSIQVHQSGVASSDHLSAKECWALIEYLIQYLEKSILAMNQVLSVAENNGVEAATVDRILQGLIDVIDSLFVAMEVSSTGSGLTLAMLEGYLNVPEKRECLKMGTYQYQEALEGCRACYQFMAQSVT